GEFAFDSVKNISFDVNSLGICAEGDFSIELMPNSQKNAIALLLKELLIDFPEIKNIYGLSELISEKNSLGSLFPLNEIVSIVSGTNIQDVRKAPNGNLHYAFESRELTYTPRRLIKGNDVKELQVILRLLGYDCTITGEFDLE